MSPVNGAAPGCAVGAVTGTGWGRTGRGLRAIPCPALAAPGMGCSGALQGPAVQGLPVLWGFPLGEVGKGKKCCWGGEGHLESVCFGTKEVERVGSNILRSCQIWKYAE